MLSQYDRAMRREIEYPDIRKDCAGGVTRFLRSAPGGNFISFADVQEERLETCITDQLAFFAPYRNQKLTWEVYSHDPLCAALQKKLPAYGFTLDDEAAVMLLDVSSTPASLLKAPSHDLRRIHSREGLADVAQVLQQVWDANFDWLVERLQAHLAFDGYVSVYCGYAQDKPVAAGWTYFHSAQFATLYAGSTLPEFRGQGFYLDLLAARVTEIAARGLPYALVECGEMSRPIVEKRGFRCLTTVWDYDLPVQS